jgi:hypothetical protein
MFLIVIVHPQFVTHRSNELFPMAISPRAGFDILGPYMKRNAKTRYDRLFPDLLFVRTLVHLLTDPLTSQ